MNIGNLTKVFKYLVLFVFILFLNGCAHKIDISPDNSKVVTGNEIIKKDFNVGYYYNNIEQEVITAGGGGDKVKYQPYKETESVFRSVLVKHFNKVYRIDSIGNKDFIDKNDIKYIFSYKMNTYSFSDSFLTWPPTKFSITLDCKAVDKENIIVWEKTVMDDGFATFDEFKNDFSLSAKRASENVFKKLLIELNTFEQ